MENTDSWIDQESWTLCASKHVDDFVGEGLLYVGVDLASTADLCAVGYLRSYEKQYYFDYQCWTTQSYLESLPDGVRPVWNRAIDDGVLYVDMGRYVDYREIKQHIDDRQAREQITAIGVDPYNANTFIRELENTGYRVISISQSIVKLNSATKRARELVNAKRLKHTGNEFLTWQVRNCQLYTDKNDNVKINKHPTRRYLKVDACIALLNAIAAQEKEGELEFGGEYTWVTF